MEKMNIQQYNKYYGFNAAQSVLLAYGYGATKNERNVLIERGNITVTVPNEKETVALMNKINKVINNPLYPSNVRNRFYSYKHQLIKTLIKLNDIYTVVESENHYKFSIYGYEFHQPKNYFTNKGKPFTIIGEEKYEGKEENNGIFTKEEWKNFIVGKSSCCSVRYQKLYRNKAKQ